MIGGSDILRQETGFQGPSTWMALLLWAAAEATSSQQAYAEEIFICNHSQITKSGVILKKILVSNLKVILHVEKKIRSSFFNPGRCRDCVAF